MAESETDAEVHPPVVEVVSDPILMDDDDADAPGLDPVPAHLSAAAPARETRPRQTVHVKYQMETDRPPWPGGAERARAAGVFPAQVPFIEYLNSILQQNTRELEVEVIRRHPAQWRGFQLPISRPIMSMKPMPFQDMKKAIVDLHGGGDYTIQIVTANGVKAHSVNFEEDHVRTEPKVPVNAQPAPAVSVGGGERAPYGPGFGPAQASGGFMHISSASSETVNVREEERRNLAELQRLKAEREKKNFERKCAEEDEAYEEKQERKMRAPLDALDGIRREMDSKFDSIKDMLSQGAGSKSSEQTLGLIMKSIEVSSQASQKSTEQMMAVLVSLIQAMASNKGGSSETVEAMKLVVEANKSMVDAIRGQQNGGQLQGYEELLRTLVLKSVNGPDNRAKETLDMFERGINLAMTLRGQESEEEVIDRDNGFLGNLGNLVLHGAKNLLSGNAGGRLAAVVHEALSRNQQPMAPPAALPLPPYALPLPQPVSALPVVPVAPRAPVALPVVVPSVSSGPLTGAPVNAPRTAPYYDEIIDEESGQVVSAPAVPEAVAEGQPLPAQSDSLSEHVSHAMSLAVDDIDSQREVPDWIEYAKDKWGVFIQQLAQAPDDAARLGMLEVRCDVQVVNALQARFQQPENVNRFFAGLRALIMEETAGANQVYAGATAVS